MRENGNDKAEEEEQKRQVGRRERKRAQGTEGLLK